MSQEQANIAIIERMFAEWPKGKAAMYQSLHDYFAPNALWENVGLSLTYGADDAVECFKGFEAILTYHAIQVDMLHIAASGNAVMTERVDRLVDEAGNTVTPVRVMGVFEMADGKIAAWRDYFDTIPMAGGAPAQ